MTPVGLVADLVARTTARLAAAGVPEAELEDLRRAHVLAAGLDAYVAEHTTAESPALAALARTTAATDWAAGNRDGGPALEQEMLSGHVEGAFLAFLVRATGARRVLEVGMFTGYAALAMAEALPEDGEVVACELDPRAIALARAGFAASPAGARVRIEEGPAAESLRRLAASGERFDLVFIDADKGGYAAYVDLLVAGGLLGEGATVVVDNTLMQGEPWADPAGARSANGEAVAAFNDRLAADPAWERVLLPVRDGVTLLRRRG